MQSSFEGFHGIIPEILVGKAFQGYSGLLPNNSINWRKLEQSTSKKNQGLISLVS
ncbi:hypothetical protein [Cylindrospermopsis raciborskii]|uniref:hypothetical protein n=1 Tax=Cylindrospermopsis raciborskii TaxID=77022 RepID=UPI003DA47661